MPSCWGLETFRQKMETVLISMTLFAFHQVWRNEKMACRICTNCIGRIYYKYDFCQEENYGCDFCRLEINVLYFPLRSLCIRTGELVLCHHWECCDVFRRICFPDAFTLSKTRLQWVDRPGEKISGCLSPLLRDLFTTKAKKSAWNITAHPTHCFTKLSWLRSITSFYVVAIKLLNKLT